MKKLLVLLFFIIFLPSLVFAQVFSQPASIADLQKQIQDLLKLIQSLQQQVTTLQIELGRSPEAATPPEIETPTVTTTPEITTTKTETALPEFTRYLSRGSSGDDVRKLQAFLAKDKEIYPDALITGVFGPKTETAVKKWQEKHGIESVGIIGPKSIAKFQELGRASGVIPPGLLMAPGIQPPIGASLAPGGKKIEVSATPMSSMATTTPATATTTLSGIIPTVPAVSATSTVPASGAGTVTTPTTPVVSTSTTTTTASSTATTTITVAPPVFAITSPNGGEQWTAGNTYTITWTSTGTSVSTASIDLYKSGSYNISIASNVSNNGSVNWIVPATIASGNDYKIRVYNNAYSNNFDESNNVFSIIVPVTAPSAAPIGYWKFDGSGSNEIAGSPNAITVSNALFKSSGGKFGGYLYIPTGTDSAKIPYNSMFDLPDNFTIEFWFRQRSNQSFRQDLISKGSRDYYPSGNVNFWIWRQLWNEYNFGPIQASYVNRSTGYYVGVTNSNQLAHNQWHHVVYTKDPSGSEYYLDGVSIYRNTDSAQAKTPAVDIIIGDTAVDTDFDNLRIYNYALSRSEVLYNWAETVTGSATNPSTDTQAPSVPTGLTTAVSSSQIINLSWVASTDNVGVTGYRIYRSATQITTVVNGTSYSDAGLSAGISYSYTVAAYDAAGNVSAQSAPVSTATLPAGPPAPTNIQAVTTAGSQSQPPEMWYEVVFNYTLQSTTQSFNVYRKRPTDASFVKYTYSAQTPVNPSILPLPASGESNLYHRDVNGWQWWTTLTGLAPDALQGEYKFYVTAVDTSGVESSPSQTKSFKLYAPPVIASPADGSTVSSPFSITVSGDPSVTSPSYSMTLYKRTTGDVAWSAWPAPSTNFTYTGQALSPNDNPHRLVVTFSYGDDRSLFGTSIFNFSTSTSSFDVRARNLAAISQALNAIKEKLLKLLQEF
ncbi:peptidoglycan-binding protein [Candidatus Wolfebacteria bacterium]|nr:peptidoglycan-binding protein [Candidatus Wolfebacteria bacterium]